MGKIRKRVKQPKPRASQIEDLNDQLRALERNSKTPYAEGLNATNPIAKDNIDFIKKRSSQTHIPIDERIASLRAVNIVLSNTNPAKRNAALNKLDQQAEWIHEHDYKMSLALKIFIGVVVLAALAAGLFYVLAPITAAAIAVAAVAFIVHAFTTMLIPLFLKSALTTVGALTTGMPAAMGIAAPTVTSATTNLAIGTATVVGVPTATYVAYKKIKERYATEKPEVDYSNRTRDDDDDEDDHGLEMT